MRAQSRQGRRDGEVAGRETTTIIGVVDVQLAKGILALAGSAGAVRKGSRGTV